LPISKGGTEADTAAGALAKLGAAPAVHSHDYIPTTGLDLGPQATNEIAWGLTLSTIGSGTSENPPINFGSGIKFHVYGTEEVRWSSIEGYAAENWANQTGIKFRTHSHNGNEYVATFAGGVMKIGNNVVTHTGNHFTSLISGQTLSSSNKSFTISQVGDYSGFIFYATTDSSSETNGLASIVVPAGLLSATDTILVLGHASSSKTFSVKIDGGQMTVTNVGYIGGGVAERSFGVYGIR
jgi:hypothetical protein